MTFDEFVTKYNGKYVDYDGVYGFQCVDLMRQKVKEVDGLLPYTAIPTRGNAKDIFKNFQENQYYQKIKNGLNNIPLKGDIIFWDFYPFQIGWEGHVAIVSNAWLMGLISFDQHYGNPNFCRYVNHNYKGCLGWLHRK
jgi:CHAP domain